MREFRDPADVHPPAASYAHQVELRDVRVVMLSGQIGMSVEGELAVDRYEQLNVALDNVRRNLKLANMAIADIVKMKIYLVGEWDPEQRRTAVGTFLGDHRPTMTVVGVAALGTPEMLVEVEVTAAR